MHDSREAEKNQRQMEEVSCAWVANPGLLCWWSACLPSIQEAKTLDLIASTGEVEARKIINSRSLSAIYYVLG